MNYYGAKQLADSFRTVRKNTITVAEEIGEEHYGFRAAPNTRTVGETLVHIAMGPSFQEQVNRIERRKTMEGFDFMGLMGRVAAESQKPRSKAEILQLLKDKGDDYANWLESLSDEFLGESVSMPPGGTPPSRTRFEMILSVKEHEMHCRAQLMLIERMLGIVPHLTRAMQERMAAMAAGGASSAASRPA